MDDRASTTIRVVIIDDSPMVRHVLRTMLESDPQIAVVGEAADGRQGLALIEQLRPHVITMDVRMPVMDGLEATEHVMAYFPTPILVVTASLDRYDIDITFRMLGAGALDVIEKPDVSSYEQASQHALQLIRRVKSIAHMRVVTHLRGRNRRQAEIPAPLFESPATETAAASAADPQSKTNVTPSAAQKAPLPVSPTPVPAASMPTTAQPLSVLKTNSSHTLPPPTRSPRRLGPFPLVVIGASAGGPRVVQQILANLPPTFAAAVILVQHIAEGFGQGLADWLAGSSTLAVALATENMPLETGRVFVAPDGCSISIGHDYCIHFSKQKRQPQQPQPSVDIAMETAALVFGGSTIGILLTGMGQDGARGLQYIQQAGGYTFAQDETTAPIYGMPRAALEMNAVDQVLSPEAIIGALQRRVTAIWALHERNKQRKDAQ